jgi:hypothetical protein
MATNLLCTLFTGSLSRKSIEHNSVLDCWRGSSYQIKLVDRCRHVTGGCVRCILNRHARCGLGRVTAPVTECQPSSLVSRFGFLERIEFTTSKRIESNFNRRWWNRSDCAKNVPAARSLMLHFANSVQGVNTEHTTPKRSCGPCRRVRLRSD